MPVGKELERRVRANKGKFKEKHEEFLQGSQKLSEQDRQEYDRVQLLLEQSIRQSKEK